MLNKNHISGLFLILFFITGLAVSLIAMWSIRDKADPAQFGPLVRGQWAGTYEDLYNENLSSFELSKNIWGLLNYTFFKEGNDGVLIADNGWLFTREEFQVNGNEAKNLERNIAYINEVRARFAQQDIELVIVPVPSKARVYEERLSPYRYPDYKKNIYSDFISTMRRDGITVTDTLPAMQNYVKRAADNQDRLYLKTDTHWTPLGAELAARETAEEVQALEPDLTGNKEYVTKQVEQENYEGDLTRYVPADWSPSYAKTFHEKIPVYETVAQETPEPDEGNDLSGALFDNDVPAITLVGTSYSANDQWNFEGFLKDALQNDILNAADEGLGPFETMDKYLRDRAYLETPPRLVIWEIPERYLTFEYDLGSVQNPDMKA